MSLKKKILVKNVSNLSDARYCAGMGVQILGFAIDKENPDHIPIQDIKEIRDWVEGIEMAIQINKVDPDSLESLENDLNPDYLIIPEQLIPEFEDSDSRLMVQLEVLPGETKLSWMAKHAGIDGIILNLEGQELNNPDSGFFGNLNRISPFPVFIETSKLEENIEFLGNLGENIGLVMHGGKEIKPGYKDFAELAPVLEFLEVD